MNVGAVEDVSGAAGIENSRARHGKSGKRPDSTGLVVPDQASLSERHPAKPTAPAPEIAKHRYWFMPHLLAKALGHDRHVDKAEELVRIRSQSTAVERGQDSGCSAQLGVMNCGIRLMSVDVKDPAT